MLFVSRVRAAGIIEKRGTRGHDAIADMNMDYQSESFLREQYVTQRMTQAEIAKEW